MTKFPKYSTQICDTFVPVFVPGITSCTLQQGREIRSRLTAGGTFFRSVSVGEINNNIVLECVVTTGTLGSESVVFNYTDQNGIAQPVINFVQEFDINNMCINSGVDQLRSALSANNIITTPAIDYGGNNPHNNTPSWDSSIDGSTCLLTSFGPTNMSGGFNPPTPANAITNTPPASPPIRTGPTYSLFFISSSEANQPNGKPILVNKIIEWNGVNWVTYPSTVFDPLNPPPCP